MRVRNVFIAEFRVGRGPHKINVLLRLHTGINMNYKLYQRSLNSALSSPQIPACYKGKCCPLILLTTIKTAV